jgi:uncharacterized protein DUF2865
MINDARDARPKGAVAKLALKAALAGAAVLLSASIASDIAGAQGVDCQQLRAQIAAASQSGASRQSSAFDAAAQKQRAEIDKTLAYSRQLGCDRKKFLFFGSDPPAQCNEVYAQITRMQANLGQLQSRGSGGGDGRAELVARYQSECVEAQARPRGLFDTLFGNPRQEPSARIADAPLLPNGDTPLTDAPTATDVQAHAGSKEVCVRTCDGYFFPIGYSGSGGRSGDLQEMCRALCPNAEVALYSYPPSGDINEAVGADGTHYVDLPNALKYRKSVDDASCSCRRRGQNWAQALAEAEALLGERKTDIIVTQQKSDELARVRTDPKAKPAKTDAAKTDPTKTDPTKADPTKTDATKTDPGKTGADPKAAPAADTKGPPAADAKAASAAPAVSPDATPTDPLLGQQPTAVSRETSGIASGDATSGPTISKGQGQTEEVTGPDGVKRRVRIIDPTL